MEVAADGGDVLDAEVEVRVGVDLTDDFFGVPRRLDLVVWVAGSK